MSSQKLRISQRSVIIQTFGAQLCHSWCFTSEVRTLIVLINVIKYKSRVYFSSVMFVARFMKLLQLFSEFLKGDRHEEGLTDTISLYYLVRMCH